MVMGVAAGEVQGRAVAAGMAAGVVEGMVAVWTAAGVTERGVVMAVGAAEGTAA